MVGAEEFYYLNNFNDYVEQYNKKKIRHIGHIHNCGIHYCFT